MDIAIVVSAGSSHFFHFEKVIIRLAVI